VGGLEEAKQQMREAVELPHTNADIYKHYNKALIKGVLLWGPPGCGKTMLGKATATSLAQTYAKKKVADGFLYVKGPEILDRYVGVAEATIRSIFERARHHRAQHGYPAVIFIDEADAILGRRGSGISSDMERTIVPAFLTEMDGLEASGALVILATNRQDRLDPAVVRDGRIDRKVKVTRPTIESAAEIALLNLKGAPLANGYAHADLAVTAASELFAKKRVIAKLTTQSGAVKELALAHIVNGAMVAGLVDQAKSIALHRDIKARKRGGLQKADIVAAVDAVQRQNLDLGHDDGLIELAGGETITAVEYVR
jgi:proteasome-associated ATPase